MKNITDFQAYCVMVIVLFISLFTYLCLNPESPKVILPEEKDLITEKDTLKGYYDSKGTLHIEFNNKRNQ